MTLSAAPVACAYQIGITVDESIINMKVVLANGTYVKTSRKLHPELFWALRGAGSALGVVTHIKYQLYDYSNVRYIYTQNTHEGPCYC